MKTKLGVFDSGKGGLFVASAIKRQFPGLEVIYRDDSEHVPYGNRSVQELHKLATPILQSMIKDGCRVIVIACNTVTTNLIDRLRRELPVPLIGMEPAIKPAATATKTKVIAVCATQRTLSSPRYLLLKRKYAVGIQVLEPDCSSWVPMVERDNINLEAVKEVIEPLLQAGADQIVLGCTHYHGLEKMIKEIVNSRTSVIQPEGPVLAQLDRVLSRLN